MGRSSRSFVATLALTGMSTLGGSAEAAGPRDPGVLAGSVPPAAVGPVFTLPPYGAGPYPCPPPPLVIEVGRGLAHPARARVTYGTPACAY